MQRSPADQEVWDRAQQKKKKILAARRQEEQTAGSVRPRPEGQCHVDSTNNLADLVTSQALPRRQRISEARPAVTSKPPKPPTRSAVRQRPVFQLRDSSYYSSLILMQIHLITTSCHCASLTHSVLSRICMPSRVHPKTLSAITSDLGPSSCRAAVFISRQTTPTPQKQSTEMKCDFLTTLFYGAFPTVVEGEQMPDAAA